MIELQSTQSMKTSLAQIKNGSAGLDKHRASMLQRVPQIGDWCSFSYKYHKPLEMKDLAYLTAKTGHEFAILRGKEEDILFHGEAQRCSFGKELSDMLCDGRLNIYGHSHPGEIDPKPSEGDRMNLRKIGQKSSRLISGFSGKEVEFTANLFEII